MTRIFQHTIALFILAAILILNGCAPLTVPAASSGGAAAPASSNESAPAAEAPAAEESAPGYSDSSAAPAAESSYPRVVDPARPSQQGQYEPVTAGVTDDNEQWNDYLDYLNRHSYDLYVNRRDVSERYVIRVIDEHSAPVHDAEVTIKDGEIEIFNGRTDTGGQMYFFPRAIFPRSNESRRQWQANEYQVIAKKGYVAQSQTFYRSNGDSWTLTLNNPQRSGYTQLDIVFLLDATGSMGDEIDKLKASMADVADQIARLPEQPNVRYGLVAYRDQGDQFVVRTNDFTPNLERFQRDLANVYADSGGDTPEALNEALHRSLNDLSWRNDETVRLIVLVADAPPHLDYRWESFSYDQDMFEAVRRGIKIFPVGASNLEADGEYVFRQLAQVTGGKFVFLTYEDGSNPRSGPGTETDHEVDNYSVDTLDRLVVRLVKDELAKLGSPVQVSQQQPQQAPTPVPTPMPVPQQINCTVDIERNWTDCADSLALRVVNRVDGTAFLALTLGEKSSGYARARFDIIYNSAPMGISVAIVDSFGGGVDDHSAQAVISGDVLSVVGDARISARETINGKRLIKQVSDVVRSGEMISLEISNGRLGVNSAGGIDVIESSNLFAIERQPAQPNLYATFNRTIVDSSSGSGVSKVMITLYPVK